MKLEAALQRLWYGPPSRSWPLWPLEWLYRTVVALRRAAYRCGVLRSHRAAVPVIVVGNLTVGGTGKTPVVGWLVEALQSRGIAVAVVLRGYGGRHRHGARQVSASDTPDEVGDEAVLHARRGARLVVIGRDRVAAAALAVKQGAQLIVCDDGLQHLRLQRDVEIAVVDGERGLGNGHLLPAGPLREPASRLGRVDAMVRTLRAAGASLPAINSGRPALCVDALLQLGCAVSLHDGERRPLELFRSVPLHAIAGVGNPGAFFDALRACGLTLTARALPDHARIDTATFAAAAGRPILMTEKDAVKCARIAPADAWYVELTVEIARADGERLLEHLAARTADTAMHGDPRG